MKFFYACTCLGLLAVFGVGCDPRMDVNSNTAVRTETESVTTEAWRTEVRAVLSAYDRDHNASVARDALLSLRVPGTAREIHLALVLALTSLAEGDTSADSRLEIARTNFNAVP